jgi:photosystem I P700 chlorophyll a apoprotein A2
LGNIHDIETTSIGSSGSQISVIYQSHWGQIAIIFISFASAIIHCSIGNYEIWLLNPVKIEPVAHAISDPHFGSAESSSTISYSGLSNWLLTVGFNGSELYAMVILCSILGLLALLLALVHSIYLDSILNRISCCYPATNALRLTLGSLVCLVFDASGIRLNYHLGATFGITSIAWSGHLIHVSQRSSEEVQVKAKVQAETTPTLAEAPFAAGLKAFYTGSWSDFDGTSRGLTSTLSFICALKPDTMSLYLSDLAHHHLALGVILIVASHLNQSLNRGLAHRIRDVVYSANTGFISAMTALNSLQLQLALACGALAVATSCVSQHSYSLAPFAYLSYDYASTTALYLHHQYIASFLSMASLIHFGFYLLRDFCCAPDASLRLLNIKDTMVSHLSWVSLFLGFHTLGVYVHNDTVVAFKEPDKQLLIEPLVSLIDLGPGDLLVHHGIALGLHVTVLTLFKGAGTGTGSRLMPDKLNFAISFACDGPTRGGTCDIATWDSCYLAFFWMLNTDAWLMFYFHWKQLCCWQNALFQFDDGSSYLTGWFRDYLWFTCGSLINGYNALGSNDLSVLSWAFLGAHLTWAVGFMFLLSWRGYWQELIDIVLLMHLKTPILYDLWSGKPSTPVAVSIVQARFIGLAHFTVGFIFTYGSFAVA